MGSSQSIEKIAQEKPNEVKQFCLKNQHLYSQNSNTLKGIQKTLNRPIKPEFIPSWTIINDTTNYILVHFIGKSTVTKIDVETYAALWNIQINDGTSYIQYYNQLLSTSPTNLISPISPISSISSISPTNSISPISPTNSMSPNISIVPMTLFSKGNEQLDPMLFSNKMSGQTGGQSLYAPIASYSTPTLAKEQNANANAATKATTNATTNATVAVNDTMNYGNGDLQNLLKTDAFMILEPGKGYKLNNIYNFYAFAFTKLAKITNINKNDVICVGVIYPSASVTKISQFKSNDILDVYKNEICSKIKNLY